MIDPQVCEIWPNPDGITDLPENWQSLTVPAISNVIEVWRDAQKKIEAGDQLKTFNERLAREWAIETGVIENVFHIDRGTTVTLIEQGLSSSLIEHGATDKPPEYVISILRDHVEALDWLFDEFVVSKSPITTGRIKELQALMTAHQASVDAYSVDPRTQALVPVKVPLLRGDWKLQPNNVDRDGVQYAYCPPVRTADEMERLVKMHIGHQNLGVEPEIEAAWLHHRFTQIHPFQDGNGRVARALASLIFIQAGLFPLVITRDKAREQYIAALESADAGDLKPLVDVFSEAQQSRFDRALNIAEDIVSPPQSVKLAVEALKAQFTANEKAVADRHRLVFDISRCLEQAAVDRLDSVHQLLDPIPSHVSRSNDGNSHYYRHQVIESARAFRDFPYFANTTVYRAWVKLLIEGESAAQLLLSFHGRGSEFVGVMMCTPVFELIHKQEIRRPTEEETPAERTQIPFTDKPFEFYFTEQAEDVKPRFLNWLDDTVALALAQLQRNL